MGSPATSAITDGYADASGYARPNTGIAAEPAGVTTWRAVVPLATANRPPGSSNHAFWPPYQIAVHSPWTPATTKLCPATALSVTSAACVVPLLAFWPSITASLMSGADEDGEVRR